ncbi:MAG: hypothetical protein IKN57_06125 [Parasporobacterium sp.]|nr:hypothetical protein [Parasporobacterium sp.]
MYYVPFKQGTWTRAMWSSVFLKKKTGEKHWDHQIFQKQTFAYTKDMCVEIKEALRDILEEKPGNLGGSI